RLVTASWHTPRSDHDADAVRRMRKVIEVVSAIRSIRGEMNVNPGKRIAAVIAASQSVTVDLAEQQQLLMSLARLETLEWLDADGEVDGAAVAPLTGARVFLPLAGLINVDEEIARLAKNMARLQKDIAMGEGKLNNPRFRDNAPDEVVAKVQVDLDESRAKYADMAAGVERLRSLG
ncbi:MAG: valine--tRNA ligase, partial [Zetaproteobacteria bacterium CG12_big_fil_rev_8_21_14_0_65_54_13]